MISFEALSALLLFCLGIWLSAFFSGAETAYYRLSELRVLVEEQTGDKRARRLLWFMRHPAEFVATVLVGNNIANYVTTLAIGVALTVVVGSTSVAAEIALTLAAAPLVFLLGELVPKHVNYLTPLHSMRQKLRLFRVVFWGLRPISMPLVLLTRALESLFDSKTRSTRELLGRPQVRDLLVAGKLQGVFSDRDTELTNRLMRLGTLPIADQVRPLSFEFALPDSTSRSDALTHACQFGLTHVPVYRAEDRSDWIGGVATSDLLSEHESLTLTELIVPLARMTRATSRLTAIQSIRTAGGGFGLVADDPETTDGSRTTGFISLQALVRPLFLDAPAIADADRRRA